jgi:D-alanyl-D-alanine carboxypeptidase/D-alanyl-D-alanine-endopeptidase (penicillin-binding protein 4)
MIKFWQRISFGVFILLFNFFPLSAQVTSQSLQVAFDQFSRKPALKHALVSFVVMDAQTGKLLFDSGGHTGMVPASTLKVITAATVLETLSPSFRYTTEWLHTGSISKDGILDGDLIIRGNGDPSLGSERLQPQAASDFINQIVQTLKQKNIRQIKGRIIADDLLFGGHQAPRGWTWQDMGNYYGAGVSSLNWRENQFGIQLLAGEKVGSPTTLQSVTSTMSTVEVINEVKTGPKSSGDKVYAFAAPYAQKIFLRGTYGLDLKKQILLAMPDPAIVLAQETEQALLSSGISVRGGVGTASTRPPSSNLEEPSEQLLGSYASPLLSELVFHFNQKSINLYGEAFLRTAFLHVNKEFNGDQASEWMRDYWSKEIGIHPAELRIMDGSGLSPENRVTPLALTKLMQHYKQKTWYPIFFESLPIINGMRMKSGTIGGVLAYTGYHTNTKGQHFVFSLLVNNYAGTAGVMRPQLWQLLNQLK